MDDLTAKQRSHCMSRIKRTDTKPEVEFRRLLGRAGIRGYKIDAPIPGRPDIYFSRRRLAVFIDGCFWHRCPECFVRPKSNKTYWDQKIRSNVLRDRKTLITLKKHGIDILRFWEHEVRVRPGKCYNRFEKAYEKNSDIQARRNLLRSGRARLGRNSIRRRE
ncbi:very short patch repair endonuclease [Candidatus Kaiserbacteria bacterium]|nr:very short patch repair endonuclease [Candidatus Kaiserbacteria bacterium]